MSRISTLVLLAVVVATGGCGLSASVSEESDPYRDETTYSREVSFGALDRFEEAQRLEQARDFEGAVAIYRNLYQTAPDDEVKARALLEWAQCERNAFNPDRDPGSAKARLELLLETYPDSEVAAEAADELSALAG